MTFSAILLHEVPPSEVVYFSNLADTTTRKTLEEAITTLIQQFVAFNSHLEKLEDSFHLPAEFQAQPMAESI